MSQQDCIKQGALFKSLIYRVKNRMPRIEPWGTPQEILLGADLTLLNSTNCVESEKQLLTHSNAKPRIP